MSLSSLHLTEAGGQRDGISMRKSFKKPIRRWLETVTTSLDGSFGPDVWIQIKSIRSN
jgi:hypothetical protein